MRQPVSQDTGCFCIMEQKRGADISNVYGYIRVSTREQNEKRQCIALREAGVPEKAIFLDKQSGKDFNRPQYKRLLRKLKKDDLSTSRASTVWEEIMRKSCSSGGC